MTWSNEKKFIIITAAANESAARKQARKSENLDERRNERWKGSGAAATGQQLHSNIQTDLFHLLVQIFFATKYHEHRTSTAFFPLVLAFLLAAFRFARADLAVLTADSVLELINFFFSTFNFLQHLLYYILYMWSWNFMRIAKSAEFQRWK